MSKKLQAPSCWTTAIASAVALLGSAGLTACGGSGDDGGGTPVQPPAPTTISGTAATSTAIAGAAVTARCVGGDLSTTTDATGHYSVTLTQSTALPCSIEATSSSLALHSVAAGSGDVVANVTRVTDFVVASLSGADPAAFHAGFGSGPAAGVTSTALAQAQVRVASDLVATGLDATAVAAPLTATLAPGATTGYGAAVAQLEDRVAAGGATQAQLSAAFAMASPAAPAPSGDTASLPAAQLLAAPAADCASLRSGRYRVLSPVFGDGQAANQSYVVNIDAATLQVSDETGVTDTFQANGNCRFAENAGTATAKEFVVSPAGVLVGRALNSDGNQRLFVAFPEQVHTVADLAGDYVALGFDETNDNATSPADAVYAPGSGSPTLTATGTLGGTDCNGFTDCIVPTDVRTVTARSDGGFLMTDATAGWSELLFAYRSGGGQRMVVSIADDGSLGFVTPAGDAVLPQVGDTSANWGFFCNTAGVVTSPASDDAFTVQSTDTTAGTWTRRNVADGHVETMAVNDPRAGYVHRPAATATTDAGATVNVRDYTRLTLRGMGVVVGWQPALGTGAFVISAQKP